MKRESKVLYLVSKYRMHMNACMGVMLIMLSRLTMLNMFIILTMHMNANMLIISKTIKDGGLTP